MAEMTGRLVRGDLDKLLARPEPYRNHLDLVYESRLEALRKDDSQCFEALEGAMQRVRQMHQPVVELPDVDDYLARIIFPEEKTSMRPTRTRLLKRSHDGWIEYWKRRRKPHLLKVWKKREAVRGMSMPDFYRMGRDLKALSQHGNGHAHDAIDRFLDTLIDTAADNGGIVLNSRLMHYPNRLWHHFGDERDGMMQYYGNIEIPQYSAGLESMLGSADESFLRMLLDAEDDNQTILDVCNFLSQGRTVFVTMTPLAKRLLSHAGDEIEIVKRKKETCVAIDYRNGALTINTKLQLNYEIYSIGIKKTAESV
ncbi:MAG: hypothetical protein ACE5DM_04580, partial [Candidatus Nanoarchaeia archaeon]